MVGGSQGARKLNDWAVEIWPMVDDGSIQFLHQVGERNLEEFRASADVSSPAYHVRGYLEMPVAMASADLVIGRSGASTIAEITAARLPSMLVPYPYAYADHQKLNAEYLVERGAAVLWRRNPRTAEMLAETIRNLRSSPEKLAAMASASASLGKPDAAKNVAEVVRSLIDRESAKERKRENERQTG